MGLKSFLGELRRRHVFRVAAWYAVAAWLVIQIATNTFPHLLLPDWTVRLVIVLCLIGFPIAVTLAWALEITPEGFKVSEARAPSEPRSSTPPWRSVSLWLALAGGILLGAGALQAWRSFTPASEDAAATKEPAPAAVPARILAVLPFENLGGDANNAAFTAGIHDSLITRIAKIGGMTVISRTSVMAYEGARPNLKDVAKALGVTHVIEGSVQRAGEQVRIQAQLIDAATDTHLWAESYDRTLAEGFATQNEIAIAIAQELSIRLSDRERELLESIPTRNNRAYEEYILGRADIKRVDLASSALHYEAAVELDPQFALAFAELSIVRTSRVSSEPASRETLLAAARESYEQALSLKPELPEGILARGAYYYLGMRDFAAAEADLSAAARLLPNSYLAQSFLGHMRRRQGRWQEAASLLERAAAIEPADISTMASLLDIYAALHDRKLSERAVERARAANPASPWPAFSQARLLLGFDGDVAGHVAILEEVYKGLSNTDPEINIVVRSLWFGYLVQGRYQEAVRAIESSPEFPDDEPGARASRIGWAYRLAGDQSTANRWLEDSLSELPPISPQLRKTDLADHWMRRANRLAGLGRADEATASVHEALAILPRSADEVDWSNNAFSGFSILGQIGDTQGAVELARQLLDPPSTFLPYDVWFHAYGATLRANPEFRELLARHGVDVSRDPLVRKAGDAGTEQGPRKPAG